MHRVSTILSVGAVGLCGQPLLSTSALAQDTSQRQYPQTSDASAPSSADPAPTSSEDQPADIVVTGSRIASDQFNAPNPITQFDSVDIMRSGRTNITDFLLRVPALVSSVDRRQTAGSADQEAGLNLLNLRNLGTARTLVLVNGRRHVAGQPDTAAVDTNTIPTDLIDRVDTLTGGASAIYGADSVSGVVNFILKRDFEGITARFQNGISQYGDAGNRFASVTAGRNFSNGRGNVSLAYQYNADDRVTSSDRAHNNSDKLVFFLQNQVDLPDENGIDNGNLPDNVPFIDVRLGDVSALTAVALPDDPLTPVFTGAGAQYDRGVLLAYAGGLAVGGTSIPLTKYQFSDLQPKAVQHNVNLISHFDFSDAFKVSFEGGYVHATTNTFGLTSIDYGLASSLSNPYIPANIVAAANAAADAAGIPIDDPTRVIYTSRANLDFPSDEAYVRRETYQAVIDAKGRISDHATYDMYYAYGQTRSYIAVRGQRYSDRFMAAADVILDPATGQPTCRSNIDPSAAPYAVTFTPGADSGCVPLNLFRQGQDPAALAFVVAQDVTRSTITQQVANASITGDFGQFFSLPGGPIKFSIGGEYRRETSNTVPGPAAQAGVFIRYPQVTPVYGKFHVGEFFSELKAPILRDVPFAKSLSLGAAFRYSDYSTSGGSTTWQFNGVYSPVRDVTFRGSYSKAVRAPNIGELFQPGFVRFAGFVDPCDISQIRNGTQSRAANCASLLSQFGINPATFNPLNDLSAGQGQTGTQTGNPNLKPELAKTLTAGIVLRPRFIPNLIASFDWYDIRIRDAINTPDPQQIANLCVDSPTIQNPYCSQLNRDPGTGFLVGDNVFQVMPQNVAAFNTSGLEVNISYDIPTKALGDFNLRLVGGYMNVLTTTNAPGAALENGLNAQDAPQYNANLGLGWAKDRLSLSYNLGWQGKTRRFARLITDSKADYVAPRYFYNKPYWQHDASISYDVNDRLMMTAGVNNFTDEKPDIDATSYPVSFVGRFFYLSVGVNIPKLF